MPIFSPALAVLTTNKSQLYSGNISDLHSFLWSAHLYLFLNLKNYCQTNIATQHGRSVTRKMIFVYFTIVCSWSLQFDFILEIKQKNVGKMYLEVWHCVRFWQEGRLRLERVPSLKPSSTQLQLRGPTAVRAARLKHISAILCTSVTQFFMTEKNLFSSVFCLRNVKTMNFIQKSECRM